jgi:citrate synthase
MPEAKRVSASPGARTKLPSAPPSEGRGGPQHKYLQELVRRWAASKGYKTTIEKQILDGLGSVDVALEKEGRSIACEIGVTTTVEHEVDNVQKCLAAGFEHVVLLLMDRKMVTKAKDASAAALSEEESARVHVLTPEEFFAFAETLDAGAAGKDGKVRGYKVKVQYQAVGEEEKKAKKQAISQVIMNAVRRLKRGDKG